MARPAPKGDADRRPPPVGTTGLTDRGLARALDVSTSQLGRELKVHAVTLESAQSIVAALQPACQGAAVAEAGTLLGATFHPMVIVGSTMSQDTRWTPPALRFAEFVGCVDADVSAVVETCAYVVTQGAGFGQTRLRTRNQHSRHVRVVNAATGATVSEQVFQGPPPDACPEVTSSVAPIGTAVSNVVVSDFLAPFVGDVPNIVVVTPPPTEAVTFPVKVTPASGMAGTTIKVKAKQCDGFAIATLLNGAGATVATSRPSESGTSTVTVPTNAAPGSYRVEVTCVGISSGQPSFGTATFKVVAKES